jgi:peptidoglycan/LPS O-acetylase OafA/YrhL
MRYTWLSDAKGLAILSVVLFWHAWGMLAPATLPHGDIGVDVFLILSGFGLAIGLREESLWAFYRRRFLNLAPRYWICVAFFALLFALTKTGEVTIPGILIDAAFGSYFVPQITFVWWFLTLIVPLYLVFGMIRRAIRAGDIGTVLFIGLVLELAFNVAWGFAAGRNGWTVRDTFPGYGYIGYRIVDFFLGIAMALASLRRFQMRRWPLGGAALLGILFLYRTSSFEWPLMLYPMGGVILMSAFFALSITLRTLPVVGSLLGPILTFLGTYSYESYLLHGPLMQTMTLRALNAIGIAHPGKGQLLVAILFSLAASCALALPLRYASPERWRKLRVGAFAKAPGA